MLTDLLSRLLVGVIVVSIKFAVVAVLSAKMRSTSCLHADFLVCVCTQRDIL